MSWFVFNGKHSAAMGIMVLKMPPITRPPMRYDIIKTDGLDGAGIYPLGYDIYEKTIEIFIEDPYNIDGILAWLTGNGTLIFSNEKDKYYKAQALLQIDFENIVRTRTAKVTFLVQPFKYAVFEEPTTSTTLFNRGNIYSLPLMRIYGTGTVTLYVNQIQTCILSLNETITLDSETHEAKQGTINKNRSMRGNFPVLQAGENKLSWTGNITQIQTTVRSRWL